MNKNDLISAMAKQTGLTKVKSELALNAFTESVQKTLKKNGKITLVGFGTWEVRQRAARTGINPQTKKTIKIPAKKVPVFRAGKNLKGAIKQ